MDTELKNRWVEALRSGHYEQTQGQLRYGGQGCEDPSFCCLGVLADLVDHNGWQFDAEEPERDDEVHFVYEGKRDYGILPEALREFVGLTEEQQRGLSELNDTREWSFSQIADAVEALL